MLTLKTLIRFIDLTRLNSDDTQNHISQLCKQAQTPSGPVAAVCISPRFIRQAQTWLKHTPIKIATVANFPKGDEPLIDCLESIKQSLTDGANEIDLVMPYQDYLAGHRSRVKEFLEVCRGICPKPIILKVILETGALINHDLILDASTLAIEAGADFIKTSTGKITAGATLEAAELILSAIKKQNPSVGLKISGGIRTVKQASEYFYLAQYKMGSHWISPNTLRFGVSQLLSE